MHFLRLLWPFARNWWGTLIGIISVLSISIKGVKPLFEAWDWFLDRMIDYKVRDALHTRIIRENRVQIGMAGLRQRSEPLTISEISELTGMTEKGVRASLKRLKRKGDAFSEQPDKWQAKIPSLC